MIVKFKYWQLNMQVASGVWYYSISWDEWGGVHLSRTKQLLSSVWGWIALPSESVFTHILAKNVHLEWGEYIELILVLAKCAVGIFFWVLSSSKLSTHIHLKTDLIHHIPNHFWPNCQNLILVQLFVFTRSLDVLWHYFKLFSFCPIQHILKSLG